jgi:hypothetical protein
MEETGYVGKVEVKRLFWLDSRAQTVAAYAVQPAAESGLRFGIY